MEEYKYNNFVIKKFNEDRLNDVQYLFKVSFNSKLSIEVIKNKHLNCHGTEKYIGFLAYEESTMEPAGFYAVFPGNLVYKNQVYLVAQSGDTMTNPKFQKKGLFVKLAQITYSYCEKIGIKLITGLPNENSYPGFIKHLNFSELPIFSNLLFVENRLELTRITRRIAILQKFHFFYSKCLFYILYKKGKPFNNSNNLDSSLAFMDHDTIYFESKKNKHNIFVKDMDCSIWLRMHENSIIICDISCSNSIFDLDRLMKKLKIMTYITGFRFLNFGSTRNSFLYKKIFPFAKSKHSGYRFIVKNLCAELPTSNIALLSSDADVF
jgi:hypothetical protein